jgi:NAD(P)-dependent dehydrogenase (short-subunit alcohol dehydrogenase family)
MANASGAERCVALVTGASFGVGAATALALAREGYDLVITATRLENLAATRAGLAGIGGRVVPLELDLRVQPSIEHAVAETVRALGRIDLLVNNAGANLRRLAADVTRAEWDAVMAINLTGTFFLTQAVGRHLIATGRPGAIVSIASTHALLGAAERSSYGISKAALLQMTRMLAVEWAPQHIRVNAIAPGRMETASPSRASTGSDPAYMQAMLAKIPLRRLATAEEVAAAVCYLASPHAASMTGQTLVLDGGLTVV